MKKVSIIGGGPAALMLAAQLDTDKYQVTIYDKKKAVGRKFLVAGEGGLNLTFNAPLDELINQYHPNDFIAPILQQFTNEDLRNWFKSLEIPTFLGSSNRVFPAKELKPIDVLNKIIKHLMAKDVQFKLDTQWTGWNTKGHLCFNDSEDIESDFTVFALGGASWKVTGSDGSWSGAFMERGINVLPFRAANCAFHIDWDKNFIHTHAGKPLKNIALKYKKQSSKGELVVSEFGLEGNALYALSRSLQDELLTKKSASIKLDLKPTMTATQIKAKYKKSKLTKVTDILKEDLSLDRTAVALIKQYSDKETFTDIDQLAKIIKAVPITLKAADDIDKAISTLGGIALDEIDTNFQLNKMPETYAIGEMLDWYAPTGGYLLQGCFSMGFSLAENLNGLETE
ncbi:MAG: putative flavoprotein (TIGR03862 family) [Bacteroidia bacterium]|jgi:uncharacterized flavoprotein (TIGR03862 family)